MRKLNSKGVTTVEILISFIIASLIVISLYTSVVALKNKETIASYKQSLTAYRDLLIRDIQSDIIEKGLSDVRYNNNGDEYTISLFFKNNQNKNIIINAHSGCQAIDGSEMDDTDLCPDENINDGDNYSISYGDENYKLPNIGSTLNAGGKRIYDLKIKKVIYNEGDLINNIFDLKIVLYHPDLGTRYSIHITSPINYD